MLEKDLESMLRKRIESRGGLCLKWVCPGWAGVPDRIILLPGGRIVFVELKRPKNSKVGALQGWWAKRLKSMGFTHYFIYCDSSVEELERILFTRVGD